MRSIRLTTALALLWPTSAFIPPMLHVHVSSSWRILSSSTGATPIVRPRSTRTARTWQLHGTQASEKSADETSAAATTTTSTTNVTVTESAPSKEEDEKENLMQKVKDAGVAGAISLAIWEGAFWCFSIPAALIGYQKVTGHWPDLSDKEDLAKLGAEAFAFVNFARFAVPLRVGLALSTTPWVQENIVDKFGKSEANEDDDDKDIELHEVKLEEEGTEEVEAAVEPTRKGPVRRFLSRFRRHKS